MYLLYFLTMILGMIICSIQDLKSYTVSIYALALWVVGNVACCISDKVYDNGIFLMLLFVALLYPYMAAADSIALCNVSVWFNLVDIYRLFITIGVLCVIMHKFYAYYYKTNDIPMMPAIALSWVFARYYDAIVTKSYLLYKGILLFLLQSI